MISDYVVTIGFIAVLSSNVTITCGDTFDHQGGAPGGMTMLEAAAARVESIRNINDISLAERRQLIADLDKACCSAQAQRSGDMKTYVRKVLKCLSALSSCDLGDQPAQAAAQQRIVLDCLSLADAIPLDLESYLVMHLGVGPDQNIDSNGKKVTGSQWQALRNRLLEHRLHLWRRIVNEIDPQWDPQDKAISNVMPPGSGVAGMDPEDVVDPLERVQYKAAIEANRKKAEKSIQQITARRLHRSYLPQLKTHIVNAYKMGPVSDDDLDMLKAYLRVYVPEEKHRAEFFEIATAAKSKAINETKPSSGKPE